jgi:DNA helicase HerA-like ATPase
MHVLGRSETGTESEEGSNRPTGPLGTYRARDGSAGAAVGVDLDRPHAGLVVGKRGSGKSYTLGVLAEAAARGTGVAPVVVDPMGVFSGLVRGDAGVPATVVTDPEIRADVLPAAAWPSLLGLEATEAAGTLVWEAANTTTSLDEMQSYVAGAAVDPTTRRAARNHLRLAESWGVFGGEGLTHRTLSGTEATVLDLSGTQPAAMNAVCAAVARGLYDARVDESIDRLPWLLVDEAHAFFDGVASDALRTLLTRGRVPGVSLVVATQRPGALPEVAVSQADLLVAHRLTAESDVSALAAAQPTYLGESLANRLPTETGDALVVDDATESVHAVSIRERDTPHGGSSARAGDVSPR